MISAAVDAYPGTGIDGGLAVLTARLDGVSAAPERHDGHNLGAHASDDFERGGVAAGRSGGAIENVEGVGYKVGPEGDGALSGILKKNISRV